MPETTNANHRGSSNSNLQEREELAATHRRSAAKIPGPDTSVVARDEQNVSGSGADNLQRRYGLIEHQITIG